MSVLTAVAVGLLYIGFAAVPAAIAIIARRNREKPGARALVVTGASASTATVIQGFRFILAAVSVGTWLPVVLHIGLLAAINIAVLGTLYIAVEYTGRSWLENRWLVTSLVVLAVALPTVRLLTETAGLAVTTVFANGDFFYRVLVALAALSLLGRQLFNARGVYRKQGIALFAGLSIGFGFGLVERFYNVEFVEFTLIGMTVGSAMLAWTLFRYEFLETLPVARETLFDHISDPVIAFDGSGRIADINQAATTVFGVTNAIAGSESSVLFQTDEQLAAEYAETLGGHENISAVIDGDRRHFDPESQIAPILDGELIEDSPTQFGMVTGGEIRYYDLTSTRLDLAPDYSGQLVVFRDVTTERNRAADLDVLKQVLTRVLRHNLRNEVTVINGFASSIAENGDGEIASNAERIITRAEKLSETSETARRIEKVIDADEQVEFELPTVITETVESIQSTYSGTFETDVPALTVTANPEFDTAFRELLQNAIIHNDSDEPHVEIVARRIDRGVELTITDNGPGVPEHELETLNRGEESSLVHGSGAGLWLVQTAVDSSNGEIRYETDESGTTVRIRLPVAGEG